MLECQNPARQKGPSIKDLQPTPMRPAVTARQNHTSVNQDSRLSLDEPRVPELERLLVSRRNFGSRFHHGFLQ